MSKSHDDSGRSTPIDSSYKEGSVESASTASTRPRFRLIQPRPAPNQALSTSLPIRPAPVTLRRPGSCGISKCTRSPCTLPTHRQYARSLRKAILVSRNTHLSPFSSGVASLDRSNTSASLSRIPSPGYQLDSWPDLPFKKPYPPELRNSFDFFVNHLFDKLTLVFRPPMKPGFKRQQIQEILSSELLTAASLLQARNHLMQQSNDRSADALSTSLYSMVAQAMHRKLDELSHTNADDLIFCVIALLNFDLLQAKPETLATHKRGIEHLVSCRGGVHNLGTTLPFIVQTDRRLAILTGTYPMFSPPPSKALEMPPCKEDKYGASFFSRKMCQAFGQNVLFFCQNECHLIALFERNKICFDMERPARGDLNTLPYFFFCRDQLSAQFANLYAHYRPIDCKERYVLIATKIVEYPIVNGGLTIMLAEFLADQLTGLLKEEFREGLPDHWTEHQEMLSWILWVLVTAQVDWADKDWARQLLRRRLMRVYTTVGANHPTGKGGKGKAARREIDWQQGWRRTEWELNNRWMWSEEHLLKSFEGFCKRVEDE